MSQKKCPKCSNTVSPYAVQMWYCHYCEEALDKCTECKKLFVISEQDDYETETCKECSQKVVASA